MNNYPLPKEIWKHYKGGVYEIISLATHTETKEVLVIYKSISFGSVHARPFSIWNDIIETDYSTGEILTRFKKNDSPGYTPII